MRFLIFSILISVSLPVMADENIMKECKKTIDEKCVGMTRDLCEKKGLIPKECVNTEKFLLGLGQKAMTNCSKLLELCPMNIDDFDTAKPMEFVSKFQNCIRDNSSKIPAQCKSFMEYMANPVVNEIHEGQLKRGR